MIKVENITKSFGARQAVKGISFEVKKGEVLGFLGPNGAGKTTTMRLITGFLPPTSGTVRIDDLDVSADPVKARKLIGYLPENAPVYGDMTVEEFLRFISDMRGFSGKERDRRVESSLEKCLLQHVRKQTIETLSKGYRQRTCFAQAILHDPPVLILDEPTEGLDPNQKHVVRSMIRHMGREKVIILSTHILEEVEAICSRAIIISEGVIAADETPSALKKRSPSYNSLQMKIKAAPPEVIDGLKSLKDVLCVEVDDYRDSISGARVYPKDGAGILDAVLQYAHSRSWAVSEVQTDDGKLDEVFRHLTTTADVGEAGKEAA